MAKDLIKKLQIKHIEIPKHEYQIKLIKKYPNNPMLKTIEYHEQQIELLKNESNNN